MGTVIRLYGCKKCGSVMDEDETKTEKPCPNCDCRMMGLMAPTWWNIFRYVRRHPKVIFLWFKENVLHIGC